jgi:hypothetical protein
MFRDLQKAQSVLTSPHIANLMRISHSRETVHGEGMMVSGSYLVLELTPALGRLINSGDDATIGQFVVVLSHSLEHAIWREPQRHQRHTDRQRAGADDRASRPRFNGTTLGSRPEVFVPITLRDR